MSLGKNKSSNTSVTNPATVWDVQSPYLGELYQGASRINPAQGMNYANQIMGGAGQAFQSQAGGGIQNPMMMQNLQGIASGQTQNQNLQGAIQSGLGDINRNFLQNIMPGINTGSAMTNTAGGSRQGIAQGLAATGANRQANDFVAKMLSNNFATGLEAQLSANQQLGNIMGIQNMAQANAMGQAPGMVNLGFTPQYAPYQMLSDILGRPTVLGGGGSSSGSGRGFSVSSGG